MCMGLEGMVSIVTGVGQGIGRAIAIAFGAARSNVVIADKDGVEAAKVAAEASKLGAAAPALEVNVADRSAVERMTREAQDWFGKMDILVNNAAFSRLGPLLS